MTRRPISTTPLFGQPRDVVEHVLSRREAVRCPICGIDPLPFAADHQGFHLAQCPRCHLQFHSPRPPLADLAEHVYTDHYHRDDERTPSAGQERHFAHQLSRLRAALNRTGTLLDVGAGAGAFLRYARQHAWSVSGTDIVLSRHVHDAADTLFEGTLDTIDFGGRVFDAIRFNHVLEHTPDPVAELRRARSVLSVRGVVLVGVPNLGGVSALVKSLQSRLHLKPHAWRHYAALHHFWFFTPRTLGNVFRAAGYQVIEWDTPADASPRSSLSRTLLEQLKVGSVLDMYATPA